MSVFYFETIQRVQAFNQISLSVPLSKVDGWIFTVMLMYLLNWADMTLIWTETTDFLIVWITGVAADGKAGQSLGAIVLTPQSFYFIWLGGTTGNAEANLSKLNHAGFVNHSLQRFLESGRPAECRVTEAYDVITAQASDYPAETFYCLYSHENDNYMC